MHLFDPNGNSVESQTPFTMTVIILSLVTYALAGWGLWLVDRGYRGNPRERTEGQAPRSNETGGLGTTKGIEYLKLLRSHGNNSEVV